MAEGGTVKVAFWPVCAYNGIFEKQCELVKAMYSSAITSKGQTTLPSDIRNALNLKAGDRVKYVILDNGNVILLRTRSVMDLAGMFYDPARKPVTLEEMDAGIAAGIAASL
jgi:antitoxin PrlF